MSPKKNQLFRKIAISSIIITLILLWCFPLYASWIPEAWDGWEAGWNKIYLFEDEIMLIGLAPFYILFPLMLLTKLKALRIILKIVLFLLAGLYFMYGLMATGMPVQDYAPELGGYLMLALLPQLAYLHYMDMWVKYNRENHNTDNVKHS